MEVHHHPHIHSQQRWKEYTFQFIMLFIAVFLGSLAEYRLEHFIEHKRSIELARSLYQELKSDSIVAKNNVAARLRKEESLKYIRQYIEDSTLNDLPPEFYPHLAVGFILVNPFLFEPKDGMLNQLKNSGMLRYFRNIKIQEKLGEIGVAINNMRTRNEQEYAFVSQELRRFLLNHYDYRWQFNITQDGNIDAVTALGNYSISDNQAGAQLLNIEKLNKQEFLNLTSHYLVMLRGSRQTRLIQYIKINAELLEELRKEYDVE